MQYLGLAVLGLRYGQDSVWLSRFYLFGDTAVPSVQDSRLLSLDRECRRGLNREQTTGDLDLIK